MSDLIAATVSFTAARQISNDARNGVLANVPRARVPQADRYITGACVGGDAFIGLWLYENRPEAEHVVVVPADRSRIVAWWRYAEEERPVTVVEMPPGTTYADRNRRLVAEADAVFGFPAYPEDDPRSARSGTWQTIRMSRKAGNFSQWHCVNPPYAGRVEADPLSVTHGIDRRGDL